MKLHIAAFLTISTAFNANSAVISYGSYSHNTDTNVVIGDGLEWLRWPLTYNVPLENAVNSYGGGWGIATPQQIAGLINNFNFGLSWDPNNPTVVSTSSQVLSDYQSGPFYKFVAMFGYTSSAIQGNQYATWSRLNSFAIFSPMELSGNTANFLRVQSYSSISNISCCNFQETATIDDDNFNPFNPTPYNYALALVRPASAPQPPELPIPSAAWLFSTGLFGLIGIARSTKA